MARVRFHDHHAIRDPVFLVDFSVSIPEVLSASTARAWRHARRDGPNLGGSVIVANYDGCEGPGEVIDSERRKLSQRIGHEVVAVYGGRPAAEIARGLLETHGIDANLLVDDSGGLAPVAELTEGVRVTVRTDRAVEARELLAVDHQTTMDRPDQRPPAAAVRLTAAALAIVFVAMILYNALGALNG